MVGPRKSFKNKKKAGAVGLKHFGLIRGKLKGVYNFSWEGKVSRP